MLDRYQRRIDYLRLSLTERCQQQCRYCAKSHGGDCIKEKELSASDFLFLLEICADLGFRKLRLTGGEPLLRRDLPELLRGIQEIGAFEDVALTTNAQLLAPLAHTLADAGLMRCNISLDSLKPAVYKQITGAELAPVLQGIRAAVRHFQTVRLNAVLLRGINDCEINDFVDLARRYPIDVRFIELMPMGDGGAGVSSAEILRQFPTLTPCAAQDAHAPAVYYRGADFRGRVGLISPLSHAFCAACNRLRVTCDGTLRPCLGNNTEISARDAILQRDAAAVRQALADAVAKKPAHSSFADAFQTNRTMNRIGG